jgi:hypothetical protein
MRAGEDARDSGVISLSRFAIDLGKLDEQIALIYLGEMKYFKT